MELLLVSPVRLLGDGLAACLSERNGVRLQSTVDDLRTLRVALSSRPVEVVLIDVTQGRRSKSIVFMQDDFVVLSAIPLLVLFLILQRQFISSVARTGIRG